MRRAAILWQAFRTGTPNDVQVKPLSWCNGVRVGVANADAYIDNLRNNTLKKGCGI